MSTQAQLRYTPEQYLSLERASEHRSEYVGGEIFAMSGATRRHNLIVTNIISEIRRQIVDRPCEAYATDMKVQVASTGSFAYPDVVVVCATPRFRDEREDVLLNPTLLVEVLSATTEAYDRGAKSEQYRTIDSLREYLLVAQDRCHVEHYVSQSDGQWLLTEAGRLEMTLSLTAIGCALSLDEVYAKVKLAARTDRSIGSQRQNS
jgi:Uma2 family endonuclease